MVISIKHKYVQSACVARISGLACLLWLTLSWLSLPSALAASSGSLSLTPSNGSYSVGSTVTVKILEHSGSQKIGGVEADLTYDKNVLQFANVSTADSAFGIAAPVTAGGGVVDIARAVQDGTVSGDQTVAEVSFLVTAASSHTSINFAPSSAIDAPVTDSSGNTIGTTSLSVTTSGAWLILTGGATSTSNPSTGSSSSGSGKSTTPSSTNHGSATTSKNSSTTPATSSGSSPSSSQPTQNNQLATNSPSTTTGDTSTTSSAGASPTVLSSDAPDTPQVLSANGLLVSIEVVNSNGQPVEGATVTLDDGQTAKTDKTGMASFVDVSDGQHKVNISYKGKTQTQTVTASASKANKDNLQQVQIKLTSTQLSPTYYATVFVIAGAILIFMISHLRRKPAVINDPDLKKIVVGNNLQAPTAEPPNPAETPTTVAPTNSPADDKANSNDKDDTDSNVRVG